MPSNAPMSAVVNLSSDDMRVERVLERFDQERVANKLSVPVLSRTAGKMSDEKFLVARPDQRPVEVGAELERRSRRGNIQSTHDDDHREPHGLDTWVGFRHVTQLLENGCSGER